MKTSSNRTKSHFLRASINYLKKPCLAAFFFVWSGSLVFSAERVVIGEYGNWLVSYSESDSGRLCTMESIRSSDGNFNLSYGSVGFQLLIFSEHFSGEAMVNGTVRLRVSNTESLYPALFLGSLISIALRDLPKDRLEYFWADIMTGTELEYISGSIDGYSSKHVSASLEGSRKSVAIFKDCITDNY